MTNEEKAIHDSIISEIQKGMLTPEQVKQMIAESGLNKEAIETLESKHQEQLDNLGAEIKAMKESKGENEGKEKSLKEIIKENAEEMSKTLNQMGGKFTLKFPLKTILPASFTTNNIGMRLPDIGQAAFQKNKVAGLFSQFPMGPNDGDTIYYTDQTTTTRNADVKNLGDAAPESVLAWTGLTAALQQITDSIPVAKKMLNRYGVLEAEIKNFITNNLLIKEDNQLATGDGSAPDIKGVYTYATAFDSAAYAGFKPKNATLFDLIMVMTKQIEKDKNYDVDTCLINGDDMLGLELEKDLNGVRINLQMLDADGNMRVKKVKVIECNSITAGTLVLGDFKRGRRYVGQDIQLEFGYNASGDFGKGIITLLGSIDELLLIRNCEADAFLKSTAISTDIANITEPVA